MRTFDEFITEMRALLQNPNTSLMDVINTWNAWGTDDAWLFGLTSFEYGIYMDIANLIFVHFGVPAVEVE